MGKGHLHVTVDEELLRRLDGTVAPRGPYRTRSAAVEGALRLWLRRQLDREIEEYYGSRSPQEVAEDVEWSEAAARALFDALDEDEAPRKRPASKKRRGRGAGQ